MKRKHSHKVNPESIYYNPEHHGPWPWKEYLVRIGLSVACILSVLSWLLLIVLADLLCHKYGLTSGSEEWRRSLWYIAGGGAIAFAALALIVLPNPKLVPLSYYRLSYWYGSPYVLVFRIVRWLVKPTAPYFVERLVLLAIFGLAPCYWSAFPYAVHFFWTAFSLDALDKIVVYDAILAVPAAYVLTRLLDYPSRRYKIELTALLRFVSFLTNPVLLIPSIAEIVEDRRRRR